MTPNDILSYFQGEKSESLLFVGVGTVSIAASLVCFFYIKTKYTTGASIPLLLIGLIQIVVGSTVYLRTDAQVKSLLATFEQSPEAFAAQELPRMKQVNKSFDVYKITEIMLLVCGLALAGYFYTKANRFWLGLGMALTLQSSIMLIADLFAESRADAYTARVEQIRRSPL